MKVYKFAKFSGAGNDFILFDKAVNKDFTLNPLLIKNFCDRRFGVGADGVLVISDSDSCDFAMEYYNADGSTGSLCGNGARCAIKYADLSGRLKEGKARFICNSETYFGSVVDSSVEFLLHSPQKVKLNFKLKVFDRLINTGFADTGSPHVVINIKDVVNDNSAASETLMNEFGKFPVFEWGKLIRYHKDFAPDGTNVNFILIDDGKVFIRTYERGVEDETLACGTGSVASAILSFLNYGMKPPIRLITKGGDELIVNFVNKSGNITNVSLTGPAKQIFTGEIII